MDDFKLFDEILEKYNEIEIRVPKEETRSSCEHLTIVNDKDVNICNDCGEEISKTLMHDKEWRFYGVADTKHSSNPCRVQMRKNDERSIFKDVENMGFSDKIVSVANRIYTQVTNGRIKRGDSRRKIIFACIFQSFKLNGTPQDHEILIPIFNISKKSGLQGIKTCRIEFSQRFSHTHNTYNTQTSY